MAGHAFPPIGRKEKEKKKRKKGPEAVNGFFGLPPRKRPEGCRAGRRACATILEGPGRDRSRHCEDSNEGLRPRSARLPPANGGNRRLAGTRARVPAIHIVHVENPHSFQCPRLKSWSKSRP